MLIITQLNGYININMFGNPELAANKISNAILEKSARQEGRVHTDHHQPRGHFCDSSYQSVTRLFKVKLLLFYEEQVMLLRVHCYHLCESKVSFVRWRRCRDFFN